ncbi:class I SAM-dependent methyltransferase [bacterium]|nr:class I SAM-dependent methyltransferase [bacterium]
MKLCPLCQQNKSRTIATLYDTRYGNPEEYAVLQCGSCTHLYTWPVPDEIKLRKLYEENYTPEVEDNRLQLTSATDSMNLAAKYRSLIHRFWRKLSGLPDLIQYARMGKILDYGCSTGGLLPLMAGLGFEPFGLEFNPIAAQKAQRLGYEVFCGRIEESPWTDGYFDTIILSQVIEHLVAPIDTLREIAKKLKPDGRLIVACPNAGSLYRHLFGRYWAHWHVPFHLQHFNKHSLKFVAEEAGLTVKRLFAITPNYWLIMSWRIWRTDERGRQNHAIKCPMPLSQKFFASLLSRFFDVSGKGDCLIAVFEKG